VPHWGLFPDGQLREKKKTKDRKVQEMRRADARKKYSGRVRGVVQED